MMLACLSLRASRTANGQQLSINPALKILALQECGRSDILLLSSIKNNIYDIGIVGGGLAGLATAIEHARNGFSVVLFEKKKYPFHKVCGEYISNESYSYLMSLGVPLESMELPAIKKLKISLKNSREINLDLGLGGFGISRYKLDYTLSEIAKKHGVIVKDGTEVHDHFFHDTFHSVHTKNEEYHFRLVLGSFGKRSLLDRKLKRPYLINQKSLAKNFVGVKYHITSDLPSDLIGLHIFNQGYCGISKVEGENTYCLCYLTIAENLKKSGSISEMEEKILGQNPYLKEYLKFPSQYEQPEVISQIYFEQKDLIADHLIMIGDAAGLIVPLTGNGMSIALRSAHFFSRHSMKFLNGEINRDQLEKTYQKFWKKNFHKRLLFGRKLQSLFYHQGLMNIMFGLLKIFPFLSKFIVKNTHGESFYEQ